MPGLAHRSVPWRSASPPCLPIQVTGPDPHQNTRSLTRPAPANQTTTPLPPLSLVLPPENFPVPSVSFPPLPSPPPDPAPPAPRSPHPHRPQVSATDPPAPRPPRRHSSRVCSAHGARGSLCRSGVGTSGGSARRVGGGRKRRGGTAAWRRRRRGPGPTTTTLSSCSSLGIAVGAAC